MPRYNYECLNCLRKANKKYSALIKENGHLPLTLLESEVMYETSHGVSPSPEELYEACECPRCGSHKAEKTLHGSDVAVYTRGYGYLDKDGCHRDMNRFKLTQDDPYKQYREPGEVDNLKSKLDKGGKHNPKTQYFRTSESMDKAVTKAVSTPPTKD